MTPAEYDALRYAEREVARLVSEVRLAEELAASIPSAATALPELRRRLCGEMIERDKLVRNAEER